MKAFIYKLILCLTISSFSFAVYGGKPGAFLSFGANARNIGMGRAFVALADDSSAAYVNSAGMVQILNIEGSFFQSDLYEKYSLTALNIVYPMVDNYIGFSYTQLMSKPMDGRDKYNQSTGTFTDSKTAIGVSYAQQIFLPNLSIGCSGKYVTRVLADHEDARILGDIGFLFRPFKFLSVGATIQNVLDFKLDEKSADKFAPNIRGGVAYRDKDMVFTFDLENDLSAWFFGAEYKVHPMLIVRGGLNYESTNFGFSSEYSGIRFDYAYSNDDLGANNRFSIDLGIGYFIDQLQRESAVDWYAAGTEKYQNGFFLLALADMKKAYILHPDSKDIIKKLTKLKQLEKLADKLNLSLKEEQDIWSRYKRVKGLISDGNFNEAKRIVDELQKRYPNNLNVLRLVEQLEKKQGKETTTEG